MVHFSEAVMQQIAVHYSGNKGLDESYRLSDTVLPLEDDQLTDLLKDYFLAPFEKVNEVYRMYHPSQQLDLNAVYRFATEIFDDPEQFHEQSVQVLKQLFEASVHPRIKPGELYVVLFDQLQIEGKLHRALGLFKSEHKEPFLMVDREGNDFSLRYEAAGINIKKLDKGCLIFDTERREGFKVVITDTVNSQTEAAYWVDQFLQLKIRNDHYTQTNATLQVYKQFVTQHLDEEFNVTAAEKIDLLNRSIQYFKEKDAFDLEEFSTEVIGYEEGIASFKKFKEQVAKETDQELEDVFTIHDAAVKRQSRIYKRVLKLDRNFHIYIHGDKQYIERGFDEERNMHFYKVFFQNEA